MESSSKRTKLIFKLATVDRTDILWLSHSVLASQPWQTSSAGASNFDRWENSWMFNEIWLNWEEAGTQNLPLCSTKAPLNQYAKKTWQALSSSQKIYPAVKGLKTLFTFTSSGYLIQGCSSTYLEISNIHIPLLMICTFEDALSDPSQIQPFFCFLFQVHVFSSRSMFPFIRVVFSSSMCCRSN